MESYSYSLWRGTHFVSNNNLENANLLCIFATLKKIHSQLEADELKRTSIKQIE